jgi:hypothetical protein
MNNIRIYQLNEWFNDEIQNIPDYQRKILKIVVDNLNDFVVWPEKALLLNMGVTRKKSERHEYPKSIINAAKKKNIRLDSRSNGPAIAAFEFAKGVRVKRYSNNIKWTCNHLYSGKFPYPGRTRTLHAVKNKYHFTQSAGIIAIHPIADALFDEYPEFAWYLRVLAFRKFKYDPDRVFLKKVGKYGFSIKSKKQPEILK